MTESELIDGLLKKDESCFRFLVNSQKKRVYNTSLGIVQDIGEAEDITQEVFIEILESIHRFKRQSLLTTWIYRITITKSLESIRKKKRQKRFGFMIRLFQDSSTDVKTDVPDFAHPGVQMEKKEDSILLFKAIESLPENQRVAFTLSKLEELNQAEIAAAMELSESSVESLLHRAKANLRKKLSEFLS